MDSEEKKKKIRESLSKSSIRNPNTDYYTKRGKQYGEKWKKERELKEARDAEQKYADSKKSKRFKKLRSLASNDKKKD